MKISVSVGGFAVGVLNEDTPILSGTLPAPIKGGVSKLPIHEDAERNKDGRVYVPLEAGRLKYGDIVEDKSGDCCQTVVVDDKTTVALLGFKRYEVVIGEAP